MSIFDGLVDEFTAAGVQVEDERRPRRALWVRRDDVREVLRNPSDDVVDAVAAAEYALRIPGSPRSYYRQPKWYKEGRHAEARRWLAALAGGGDE